MMIPKFAVLLLSGGLDSVTALHMLLAQGVKVHCLSLNYKQRHQQEIQWAITHARRCGVLYTVMDLPELGGLTEQSWIVPNRNAIFLSVAVNVACQAGADCVVIGCNADDAEYFPDCRREFLDAMNAATKAAGYSVEICAPFLDWKKWKIGQLAQEIGVKPNEIWTCYHGGAQPCGKCPACEKLNAAMPVKNQRRAASLFSDVGGIRKK